MRTEALSFVRCPACGSEPEFLGRPEGREFIEGELRLLSGKFLRILRPFWAR